MSSDKHLSIHPPEVQFAFDVNTQMSCTIQVRNNIESYVAFKVKVTDPEKYCVRPNYGIVPPDSTCDCLVEMQAQNEAPADMHCEDKFQILSVITSPGYTLGDITSDTFENDPDILVDEYEMRVTFVPPEPATVLEASLYNLSLDNSAAGGSSSIDVQGGAINTLSNSAGTTGLSCITASEWQQIMDFMNIPIPRSEEEHVDWSE